MMNKKFSLFFAVLLVLTGAKNALAQPGVAVALNEYCVSNIGPNGNLDNFSERSDWVELYNNFTGPVNLSNYYLSNDPTNLFKWQFPTAYVINPNQHRVIWLTGRNVSSSLGVHTNFTIDQCKNQWLILSNSNGVIMDSIFVRHTKAGHSRGRITYSEDFTPAWRIFTSPSWGSANGSPYWLDYCPRPVIRLQTAPLATNPVTTNPGGFYATEGGEQLFNIYLENGVPYDTVTYPCFNVYYTLNTGEYPLPGDPNTFRLMDSMPITSTGPAHLIRAIAIPKPYPVLLPNPSVCQTQFLESFCETNTYFTDPIYQEFAPDFGVMSLSFGKDTSWLSGSGPGSPTIHVEYYDNKNQVSEGYAHIKRPINEAWLTKQKGFYITIDDRDGFGCNFEGDIFNVDGLGKSNRKIFPTLHLKAGDYESHSVALNSPGGESWGTGIMDVFVQSLAAKNNLNVNPLHIKPVVTFVNGKYWGVYDLREVYDKYYEHYYHQQSKDSLDLFFYHGMDGYVTYPDAPSSNFSGQGDFANTVYTLGISTTIGSMNNYNTLFSRLDKSSFIDYMILNSYVMNSNLWNYNVAFGKGNQKGLPGDKYHYYLWNMPSVFNFTALSINTTSFGNANVSPCYTHDKITAVSQFAGNGHGNILRNLMSPVATNSSTGRYFFQQEYLQRYQDLLNGPLKCENLLAHYDYVKALFLKEMKYHEDPASAPQAGNFTTAMDRWDTLTTIYRRGLDKRCIFMKDAFKTQTACYQLLGPYPLSVDVQPAGAGFVKLNSIALDNYVWTGNYYNGTELSLRATPSSTNYVFHHWEMKAHVPLFGATENMDSIRIRYSDPDEIVAVFTDKTRDIDMPTAFSPNGDNHNDVFRPVGSALYVRDFDLAIWNRWGEEVFRSTDPSLGWDGTSKGQAAQTGVYAYVLTYKNFNNESKILKGNLTLLR